jgi:hypothetical protein
VRRIPLRAAPAAAPAPTPTLAPTLALAVALAVALALALAVALALALTWTPASAAESFPHPEPASAPVLGAGLAQAGGAALPDTLRTRADSLRARVLERVREQSGPAPRDTTAADTTAADTTAAAPATPPPGTPGTGPALRPAGGALPLPAEADSVMRALAALPGFTPALFQGARAEYDAATRGLILRGGIGATEEDRILARFFGQGIRLEADTSIVYDDRSGRVRTVGSTLLTPERGDPVRSQSLVYDVNTQRGTARGAETTYAEGAGEWIVRGTELTVREGEIYGSRTRFTSDDRPEPNSYFEASELKVIADQILVARSVRLHFSEVPVLWLPFIAQPLQSGRRSGLLTPRFSVNDIVRTSGAYQRRLSNLGLYWAMSDYSDATLAGDWWSGQYMALTGSLRYRWAERFLQGELSTRRFWREDGGRDLALSTRNNWEPTERARVNVSGNYVSNTGLVRQNSLDPRELTSSINSTAGVQQRFGWGSLSVEARRQQFLSDDRLEMTLPSATLNISSFTLLPAVGTQARWYNNMTASGSTRFSRDVREFPAPGPGQPFQFSRTDQVRTVAGARGSFSLGNLGLGLNADYRENAFSGVPDLLGRPRDPFPILQPGDDLDPLDRPRVDYADAEVSWGASLSYQQRLFGSTSVTPSLNLGGQFLRVDSIAAAQSFVESPTRLTFGIGGQTELYGFYPGFAGFDALRHKLTPSVSYNYAPAVTPTALQEQVFGSRALGVQSALSVTLNQTWEARVSERGDRDAPGRTPAETLLPPEPAEPGTDPDDPDAGDPDDPDLPPLGGDGIPAGGDPPADAMATRASLLDADEGLSRPPPSRVVTLLALSTQAVSYDLVRADSTGRFIDGFTTQRVRNSVRSDFLRGLDFSFTHDLFEEPSEEREIRAFRPHLEQVSLGFSLDSRSSVVRLLGRLVGLGDGSGEGVLGARADDTTDDPTEHADGFSDDRVLPGFSGRSRSPTMVAAGRDGWDARLNYSLRRPRSGMNRSQMVNGTVSFRPTGLLALSWTTGFDVEASRFTDHMISVQRDMYDWEASFGFRQSVNGNWTFRFEVSLKANRDLRFDHETRNVDGGTGGLGSGGLGGF